MVTKTPSITILDPTATHGAQDPDPGPAAGTLTGKQVAIRIDILWRSWDWVADEWARLLTHDGATVSMWRSGGRVGNEGERMARELEQFLSEADVAIVGLANCGSCTSWTIHDAVEARLKSLPTVAVATEQFVDLATTLAERSGQSGLRIQPLPYPLDTLPEGDVRDIARSQYRSLLRTLGVPS